MSVPATVEPTNLTEDSDVVSAPVRVGMRGPQRGVAATVVHTGGPHIDDVVAITLPPIDTVNRHERHHAIHRGPLPPIGAAAACDAAAGRRSRAPPQRASPARLPRAVTASHTPSLSTNTCSDDTC